MTETRTCVCVHVLPDRIRWKKHKYCTVVQNDCCFRSFTLMLQSTVIRTALVDKNSFSSTSERPMPALWRHTSCCCVYKDLQCHLSSRHSSDILHCSKKVRISDFNPTFCFVFKGKSVEHQRPEVLPKQCQVAQRRLLQHRQPPSHHQPERKAVKTRR